MNPPSIVTLTMNPALDITVDADDVVPTEKIRCRSERYDAGGGGINVARFAGILGASVSAVFAAGGPTGVRVASLVSLRRCLPAGRDSGRNPREFHGQRSPFRQAVPVRTARTCGR